MAVLSHLNPPSIFSYFEALCAVPHGSGNTRQISDLCAGFARQLGLACRQDAAENVVIWKPASPGYEAAPPVILQAHLDMVCVKEPSCPKDLTKEGLDLVTDGQWVWAKGTSLGGDDGIGAAIILAILADDRLPHPPLEAVLTTGEETGMDGAAALDGSDLKGRQLLNLDSEDEGVFTAACAGGLEAECRLPARPAPLTGEQVYAVTLSGLQGGHSGGDIGKGRASANQLMGRVLCGALERVPGLRLAALHGGRFGNVICSQAEAAAAAPPEYTAALEQFLTEFDGILRNEYAGCDSGIRLTWAPSTADQALTAEDSRRIFQVLAALPQGVEAMSTDFPGTVQTSLNLGIMALETEGLRLTYSIRSSIASQKAMLFQRLRAIMALAGGTVQENGAYPGWPYARTSPLRDRVLETYRELSGLEGRVEAIHGGLECGLLAEKLPGLDIVSLGPDLRDIHSVHERLSVGSTARTYQLVCEVLRRSGGNR